MSRPDPVAIRARIRKLEHLLSAADSSLECEPILEKLAEARRQLRQHYARAATLRRVDVSGEPSAYRLFGTGIHAPLEEK